MDLTELLLSLFLAAGVTPWAFFQGACPCCPAYTCINCTGSTPQSLQVVISGIVDGSCGDCELLDGTYLVDDPVTTGSGLSTQCRWNSDSFSDICTVDNLIVFLSTTSLSVSLRNLTSAIVHFVSVDTGYNDCTWASFSVPHNSSAANCSGVSATCLVTAL